MRYAISSITAVFVTLLLFILIQYLIARKVEKETRLVYRPIDVYYAKRPDPEPPQQKKLMAKVFEENTNKPILRERLFDPKLSALNLSDVDINMVPLKLALENGWVQDVVVLDAEPKGVFEETYLQLMHALMASQRYHEGAKWLTNLVAWFPETADYWIQLASVYVKLDDKDTALAVLDAAYQKNLLFDAPHRILLARLLIN